MTHPTSPEQRREILRLVYEVLAEQKYDPIRQLCGYLLSDDPAYIPEYKGARVAISELDRTDILRDLLAAYLLPCDKKDESAE